jgi:hypothetical protein
MTVVRRFVILVLGMTGMLAVFVGTAHAFGLVTPNHCEPLARSKRTSEVERQA